MKASVRQAEDRGLRTENGPFLARPCPQPAEHGFTLVEILVALVILAVALAAIVRATGLAADSSEGLKRRMQASWEVQNRLALIRARQEWPAVGKQAGCYEADGVQWCWEQTVKNTPNPNFREITMRILPGDGSRYILAELSGYLHHRLEKMS